MLMACLLLSTACAPVPLEKLIDEALVTGDWSEVEKREKSIARRKNETLPSGCGPEEVLMCRGSGRLNRTCECTARKSPKIGY